MRRASAIAVAANVQAHSIGPLNSVIFEDPVIAACQRDHAVLRKRVRVARMLKSEPLHPNEAGSALCRNEGVLTGCDLDQMIRGRARSQTDMNRRARIFNPEARI